MWRYRSELAPLAFAAMTALAAWLLHATHPHWWPALTAATVAAAAGAGLAGGGSAWLPALSAATR